MRYLSVNSPELIFDFFMFKSRQAHNPSPNPNPNPNPSRKLIRVN